MLTLSVNRLMIKVITQMRPCHSPAQKPAGFSSNLVFPGAQLLVTKIRIKRNTKIMDSFLNFIQSSSSKSFSQNIFFPKDIYTIGNIDCQNRTSILFSK